jgi:MtN3 and saliva related transmembrane protein
MREADLIAGIGTVATVLAIVSLVPQVVRTWRTRSAMDLSGSWLTIAAVSMVLWIAYGTLLTAWSIVVANATTLFLVSLLIVMKLRFRQGERPWAGK